MVGIEWDDEKAKAHERSHVVSFDEAKEVFDFAIDEYDDCPYG